MEKIAEKKKRKMGEFGYRKITKQKRKEKEKEKEKEKQKRAESLDRKGARK